MRRWTTADECGVAFPKGSAMGLKETFLKRKQKWKNLARSCKQPKASRYNNDTDASVILLFSVLKWLLNLHFERLLLEETVSSSRDWESGLLCCLSPDASLQ